jgi:hypothetical protein
MVNLGELAIACFAYGALTGYDESLGNFMREVDSNPDLTRAEHRSAMLKWLNHWQCRQFALAYHDLASSEMLTWYKRWKASLPDRSQHLHEASASDLSSYAEMFDALSSKQASVRESAGTASRVTFGPTGTAKILFGLRPRFFVAWDEPIRMALRYDGSGASYVDFLARIRQDLTDLASQCARQGLRLEELPSTLCRPEATPAQLLDEYHWVTDTRKVVFPSKEQVECWSRWLSDSRVPSQPKKEAQP